MHNEIIQPHVPTYSRIKIVWGIICLVGPLALIVISVLLYAIISFITGGSQSDESVARTISNVILFIVGAFSAATILPGIIVGIILLATSKN